MSGRTGARFARTLAAGLGLLLCSLELHAQLALQIQGVQPTNHPVLGAAQALRFSVQGGSNGLVEFESTSMLDLSPVWTTRSAAPASVLLEAQGSYPLAFSSDDFPQASFFRFKHFTEATVRHPFPGKFPKLLGGVGYGVDEQSAFTLSNIAERVRTAAGLALSNNAVWTGSLSNGAPPRVWTPFHFWPNVIDLTLVHAWESNLYTTIVAEILALEPDRALIETQWLAEVTLGCRLFLARDFLNTVSLGTSTWSEVHFAMAINLDSPSVRELQVHGLQPQGVVRLHDPRTDTLRNSLTNAAQLPAGEVWCLCLRGNYRRSFYQAIVVDKIVSLSGPALHLVQIDQSCSGSSPGPPPTDEPEDDTPPPMEPPPPGGGGDGSNGRQQWSAARLPPVQDGQGPGRVLIADPPTGPDQPGQRNPPQPIPQLQQELPKIQMLLNQAMQTASQLLANYNHDNALLRNMSDSWIDGVQFINPWLQEVYGRYATEVTGLRAQIAPLQAQAGACVLAIKNAKQSASPPVRVLLAKRSIWDNVLDPTGPWTNLKIDCPPPIFPGSRPGEIVGLNVDSFTSDLVAGMRQGKSWDQAIAAALANPRNNPAQVALSPTSVYAVALRVWANCLRRLYEAKFRIALRQYYPELTEAQRETMIPVLFDCDRDFTPAQRAELTALQTLTTGADAKIDGLSAQIATLENQINTDVLRRFHAEARACQEQAAAQVLNAQNIQRILSAAAVEAATPGSPGSTPSYPGVGSDNGRAAFCQALQQLLMFPPVQNCPGLTAYLMSLLHGTCGQ